MIPVSGHLLSEEKKKQQNSEVKFLESLIDNRRICIIGPIRQEILSGIKDKKQFTELKDILGSFDDFPIITGDYELAAEYFNTCRNKGIQGSNTDFLICAVSHRKRFPIFTTDKDFEKFSRHITITLIKNY